MIRRLVLAAALAAPVFAVVPAANADICVAELPGRPPRPICVPIDISREQICIPPLHLDDPGTCI